MSDQVNASRRRQKKGRRSRSAAGPARAEGRTPPPTGDSTAPRLLLHHFGNRPEDDSADSGDLKALIDRLTREQRADKEKQANARVQFDAMSEQLQSLFQDAVSQLESRTEERLADGLSDQKAVIERRLQQFSARIDVFHEKLEALRYESARRPAPATRPVPTAGPRRLEVSPGFILLSGFVSLISFLAISTVLISYFAGG